MSITYLSFTFFISIHHLSVVHLFIIFLPPSYWCPRIRYLTRKFPSPPETSKNGTLRISGLFFTVFPSVKSRAGGRGTGLPVYVGSLPQPVPWWVHPQPLGLQALCLGIPPIRINEMASWGCLALNLSLCLCKLVFSHGDLCRKYTFFFVSALDFCFMVTMRFT